MTGETRAALGDFIGDRDCTTHHACDCMKRKAAAYEQLAWAVKKHRSDTARGVDPTDPYDRDLYAVLDSLEGG